MGDFLAQMKLFFIFICAFHLVNAMDPLTENGCFLESTALIPEDSFDSYKNSNNLKNGAQGCQEACQADSKCFFFQYNKADQKCWFKKDRALLATQHNVASNKFKDSRYTDTSEFIFGPKYCNGICPIACACHSLEGPLGSMPLNQHGFCEHYCSKPTSNIDHAGFCGSSSEYRREGSTDCRGCKGFEGSHLACTKSVLEVSRNETFVVGCKARPEIFDMYYCKITIILQQGKEVSCTMYKTCEDGTYTPYEGYCEETLIKNYVTEIGNALSGGCGFEIDASKTNIDAWKGIILNLGWSWTNWQNGLFNPRNEATFKIKSSGEMIGQRKSKDHPTKNEYNSMKKWVMGDNEMMRMPSAGGAFNSRIMVTNPKKISGANDNLITKGNSDQGAVETSKLKGTGDSNNINAAAPKISDDQLLVKMKKWMMNDDESTTEAAGASNVIKSESANNADSDKSKIAEGNKKPDEPILTKMKNWMIAGSETTTKTSDALKFIKLEPATKKNPSKTKSPEENRNPDEDILMRMKNWLAGDNELTTKKESANKVTIDTTSIPSANGLRFMNLKPANKTNSASTEEACETKWKLMKKWILDNQALGKNLSSEETKAKLAQIKPLLAC